MMRGLARCAVALGAAVALLGTMAGGVSAAPSYLVSPATVGSPNPAYGAGATVDLVPTACSGTQAGAWVAIPQSYTAAIDAATAVWDQPSSWIINAPKGITAPAAGQTTCYAVAAVNWDGGWFGTAPTGAVRATLYPSGNWAAPTKAQQAALPTLGTGTGTTNEAASLSVSQAVYTVQVNSAGDVTSAPATKMPQQNYVQQFEHGGKYYTAPPATCQPPDVLVWRSVPGGMSVSVCVVPDTQTQTQTQTVQQGKKAPPPFGGYGPLNGMSNTSVCFGGPHNLQPVPKQAGGGANTAEDLAWCSGESVWSS